MDTDPSPSALRAPCSRTRRVSPKFYKLTLGIIIPNLNDEIWGGWEGANAQGGLARLAQARQNRPGKGELDLTDY